VRVEAHERDLSHTTLLLLAALVPSVILHEVSHGAVAYAFGDDTAKRAGRLTLNPIRHVDPFGTVILPLLLALTHAPIFGYAKPVPVNPRQLRNPRDQSLLVSLAGPATNVVIAVLAAAVLRSMFSGRSWTEGTANVVLEVGIINVVLATFNMIPVPPLDGSAVIERLLPAAWWPQWLKIRQYSFGLLFLLVFWAPRLLDNLFGITIRWWGHLL
jgi:Zn-dependent protease